MRTCRDCKGYKENNRMVKNHICKEGIDTLCLVCNRKRVKEWRKTHSRIEATRRYYKKHREKRLHTASKYRAVKLKALPSWLSDEDFQKIKSIYREAVEKTDRTGVQYVVDHIVPLQGKLVCGLHVPWNLQIITFIENCVKGNKFEGY